MKKLFLALGLLLTPAIASAEPRMLTGGPEYENEEARRLIEAMVEAHGGAEPWKDIEGLRFKFITKIVGNGQRPLLSIEQTDLVNGTARLEFPYMDAVIAYDGEQVWSKGWRYPLPPGFFTGLTTSFITLPWLTQRSDANLSAPRLGAIPNKDELYHIVTLTFDRPGPQIPGAFYELFIDRETNLLEGIGFNITHPGMAANPNQPIGPNFHRIIEYTDAGGLKIPSYYITESFNASQQQDTYATHAVFDLEAVEPLTAEELRKPDDGLVDESTSVWWRRED